MGLRRILSTLRIQNKLALLFILAALLFSLVLIGIINPLLHKVRTEVIADHQKDLLTVLQTEIDTHIRSARAQLSAVAQAIPARIVNDPPQAQKFLEEQIGIAALFDNGLTLLTPDGTLVAEVPRTSSNKGIDFSSYPLFEHILETQEPRSISAFSFPQTTVSPGYPVLHPGT